MLNFDFVTKKKKNCRLRLYVHDYMIKRGMHNTAEIFRKEGNVSHSPVGMSLLLHRFLHTNTHITYTKL